MRGICASQRPNTLPFSVHRTPDCVMYGTMQGSYDDLSQAMDMENPVGTMDAEVISVLLVCRSVPRRMTKSGAGALLEALARPEKRGFSEFDKSQKILRKIRDFDKNFAGTSRAVATELVKRSKASNYRILTISGQ